MDVVAPSGGKHSICSLVSGCSPDGGDKLVHDTYVKEPSGYISVSIAPLAEQTLDVRLERTDERMKLAGMEEDARYKCEWGKVAERVCERKEGKTCYFKTKK